jgi:hypothetical protein
MLRWHPGLLGLVLLGAGTVLSAETPREAPRLLRPAEHGVGTRVPDVAATDLAGKTWRLADLSKHKALVVALTSTSCPLSKKYAPALARLEQTYRDRGVAFLFVNPIATDTAADIKAALAAHGFAGPYFHDVKGTLARTIGATSTTDVLVLDAARTVVYHGAVDDQYGLGYAREAPRRRYLVDALEAVLAGKTPEVQATAAPGCVLDLRDAKAPAVATTYHNRISRIVQSRCLECHRKDGAAPFALETQEDLAAHKGMIRKVIERGSMPPWFAAAPAKGETSPWSNDRSLSVGEKADMLGWLAAGLPTGDKADAPLPRTFPKDWQIGAPDAIVQIPQPITVKAEGTMPYQTVQVKTTFTEDKWVQAMEIQPTAREVVHHVLVFALPPGNLLERLAQARDEGRRGFFAAYVPGTNTLIYPEGFAKRLQAGSTLVFQIHYTPNGTETKDQTRLGLVFARKPPEHEVQVTGLSNRGLKVPPGADNHPETATLKVPADVRVLAFLPHMHLRGKAFRYDLELPDGGKRTLLDVPHYDFNWQLVYRYAEPVPVPRGSTVKITGWFDNSKNNPANPDPTRTVRWGPQTFDEMLLGYVEYYTPTARR